MKEILNVDNEEYARKCFEKAVEIGIDFKLNGSVKEKNFNVTDLEKLLLLPSDGSNPMEVLTEFNDEIVSYCTNFSNENFMGFPDAGNSIAGISGAIVSDFMQQNLINSTFCAPIATFMEFAVIKWLRELVGYEIVPIKSVFDSGGIITYGGTGSNTTAMLLARENFRKNTMFTGVNNPEDFKVIIPKGIGHYSIKSACMWIGCGDNVIEVETKDFKYDLDELKRTLVENKGHVMCVVAYVGDSRTMTIDNLEEIYKIVKDVDENIWLHADACHGFSLAFSSKLKDKIRGINLFDSISTDPHKVLAIPYCISALLLKNPEKLKLVSSTSDLIMQEDFAYGQVTPFIGSKSWISLKLWFAMKSIGINGYEKIIDRRCEMAKYLENQINNSEDFVMINDVNINSVVFMYVGDKSNLNSSMVDKLNELNLALYERLLKEGKYYLHKFSLPDSKGVFEKDVNLIPLRYMSGNDNITEEDINNMLDHIRILAKEIVDE